MQATEGFVDVPGGRVWYRSAGAGRVPLLVLHGGPGAGHDYLEPIGRLASERPVVFYDQLGCGRSDRPDDPGLWRIERFVDELARVRKALGLSRIHLFGHSWGGFLAIEYLLGKPPGIAGVVLASTSASMPQYVEAVGRLKAELPGGVRDTMDRHESAGDHRHPEYEAAVMEFYRRHLCRLDPWPDCLMRSLAHLDGNPVYATMNGPNEFTVLGNLRDWERRDRLGEIAAPTLVTVGRYDEIPLSCARTLHEGIAGSEIAVFERSSHTAMLEETDAYLKTLSEFMTRTEDGPSAWRSGTA
jgi:proline-specific peptidase